MLTLALPIPSSKLEAWRRFCQDLQVTYRKAFEASRRRVGITLERYELVQTAFGTAVVVTVEADDVAAALELLAASEAPFDRWFKEKLSLYHGLDLAPTSLTEQREMIFEWKGGIRRKA
jgi:hypothetical protein